MSALESDFGLVSVLRCPLLFNVKDERIAMTWFVPRRANPLILIWIMSLAQPNQQRASVPSFLRKQESEIFRRKPGTNWTRFSAG